MPGDGPKTIAAFGMAWCWEIAASAWRFALLKPGRRHLQPSDGNLASLCISGLCSELYTSYFKKLCTNSTTNGRTYIDRPSLDISKLT